MKTLFTVFLFLFSYMLNAQDSYQPDKTYSPSQLREDFDILVQSLQDYHPAFYEFTDKPSFDKFIQNAKANLKEEMTEAEFHLEVRKLIAQMGCGHTIALPSVAWYKYQNANPKSLPLMIHLVEDKMYIKYCSSDTSGIYIGKEIIAINDRKAIEILNKMREIQQKDGYTQSFVNATVQRNFSVYHLFLFGPSDTYDLKYKDANGNEKVMPIKGRKGPKQPTVKINSAFEGKGMRLHYDDDYKDLALLDINSFATKEFKKNYKYIFQDLNDKQIKHLVIDLRNNGGGYFSNGNLLLSYFLTEDFEMKFSRSKEKPTKNKNTFLPMSAKLTKMTFNLMPDQDKSDPMRNYAIKYKPRKKNHFDGNVYVLTNGGSFSMSGLVATRLKHEGRATIVGTETGGGENGSYAILNQRLNLPNTKVRVLIPHFFLDHDVTPEEKGRGVIPDIMVKETIEDILSGTDQVLEAVKAEIK
ncbi:S41 family peptidase [Saprospiraceae bacterium]|nr:S41 family peptidase [Saprospiraceae bacterium]